MRRTFERFVAIGDSTVEGLEDSDGEGGYRGWADRLADLLASQQGRVWYANLGLRGRKTRQVCEEQLDRALAMRPDLAAVVSGTNDVLARHFDPRELRGDVERMQCALTGIGATVITFTLPDLTPVMPLARLLRNRVAAMNGAIRDASAASGAIVCDLARVPVAADPRLWSEDRLHANSAGHERIAAALAFHLQLEGSDEAWAEPLAARARTAGSLLRAEIAWIRLHLGPWLWRHLHGRSSGDGRRPKRQELSLIESK